MGLFHKLAVGLKRTFGGKSIEHVSGQKSYGNHGEDEFSHALREALPNAIIKSNVMVETPKGRCEIDTLVKYRNKLFIIEVKHWKGVLIEEDGYFISRKIDKYTDEIHQKEVKSPFGQIKRQAYLLKEMSGANPWINTIIFFMDADVVRASDENVWFTDFNELIDYITNDGRTSYPDQISKCLSKCRTADYIYSSALFGERNLHCMITPASLAFSYSDKQISKDKIKEIRINHHFSYDEIYIELKNGETFKTRIENGYISVLENGTHKTYSFSKIDWIIIGD